MSIVDHPDDVSGIGAETLQIIGGIFNQPSNIGDERNQEVGLLHHQVHY